MAPCRIKWSRSMEGSAMGNLILHTRQFETELIDSTREWFTYSGNMIICSITIIKVDVGGNV